MSDHFELNEPALEVQRLVLSGQILLPNNDDLRYDSSVKIVPSLGDIDRYRDPDFSQSEIRGRAWIDVVRVDDARFQAHAASRRPALCEVTNQFAEEFDAKILSSCRDILPDDECHYISTDLWWIMTSRAAVGIVDESFVETRLRVYKNGGFPFGWCGEFPKGHLAVFTRADSIR